MGDLLPYFTDCFYKNTVKSTALNHDNQLSLDFHHPYFRITYFYKNNTDHKVSFFNPSKSATSLIKITHFYTFKINFLLVMVFEIKIS